VWGYSPGETTWGVGGFNPNFAKLEALLHLSVTSITSTPPLTPANGMVYIVGGSPTGVWAGHAGAVAAYYTTGGWLFVAPVTGVRAWNVATSTYWRYTGSTWVEEPASGNVSGPTTSVANAVPVYADATGKLLADSGIDFDDLLQIGAPLVPANLIAVDGGGRAIDSGISIGGLGTGTVVGPATAVAGNLAIYYDATGEVIDDSGIPAADVILAGGTLVPGNLLTVNADGDLVDTGLAAGGAGASVTVADTPPSPPAVGDLWWDSSDGSGQLYLWYDDGTSAQWAPATNVSGTQGPAGPTGPAGATGPTGPAGATGATGPNWTVGSGLTLTADTLSLTTPALPLAGGTLSGDLTVGGNLFVTGGNSVSVTGIVTLSNDAPSGGYNKIFDNSGSPSIFLGNGAGTAANVYQQSTHLFNNRAGTLLARFDGAGCAKPGGGTWADSSDIRVKQNVLDYTTGLDAVLRLRPVSFEFNGKGETPSDGKVYVGLIANEAKEIMPEMVGVSEVHFETGDAHLTEILTLDATALIYALTNSCKELAAQNKSLAERVAALEVAR
jgi:hypothetical protein